MTRINLNKYNSLLWLLFIVTVEAIAKQETLSM